VTCRPNGSGEGSEVFSEFFLSSLSAHVVQSEQASLPLLVSLRLWSVDPHQAHSIFVFSVFMADAFYRKKDHMKTIKRREENRKVDVTQIIRVDMVFDGVESKGWVHTHGMWEAFGLPDLEIVHVSPLFLMPTAGGMLNHIAQYMVDGVSPGNKTGAKPLALGEKMGLGGMVVVKFELAEPLNKNDLDAIAGHYTTPRWRAVPVPEMYECAHPAHKEEKPS